MYGINTKQYSPETSEKITSFLSKLKTLKDDEGGAEFIDKYKIKYSIIDGSLHRLDKGGEAEYPVTINGSKIFMDKMKDKK